MKLQRALDPAAATDAPHFGELAVVAPPAPVGETVEVSEPDDASERDADRMAEQALSGAAGARVVPAVGGRPRLQRAVDEQAAAPPGGFIVDDEAAALLPGQMRKREFLRALREEACAATDRELARVGRDTEGCPYLARWFDYYEQRDARQVERALRKYAPEAARATSAAGYIPIVSARAAQAARQWAQTGALPDLPEGMGAELMGGGLLGAIGGAIGAIGGAIGGALSAIGGLFFKAEHGGARGGVDRGALESRLGPGAPLDGGAQARMGAAFGHDFSRVRVHADSDAAQAASGLNARAFTLGNHVAFAAGQYRPGDLVGDALLAHELAHVVQQGAASGTDATSDTGALEADADRATVGAMKNLYGAGEDVRPRARSGLRLSRCDSKYALTKTPRPAALVPKWNNRPSMEAPLRTAIADLWASPYDVDHNTAANLSQGFPPVYRGSELTLVPDPWGNTGGVGKIPDETPPWLSRQFVQLPPNRNAAVTDRGSGGEPAIILGEGLLDPPNPNLIIGGTQKEKDTALETILVHETAHAVNKPSLAGAPEQQLDPDTDFGHYMTEFGARWVEPRFRKYDEDRRAEEIKADILGAGGSIYDNIRRAYQKPEFKKRVNEYTRPKGFILDNKRGGSPPKS